VQNQYSSFKYQKNSLYVEGISLQNLASQLGTPLYVYSGQKIISQFKRFDQAFGSFPHTLCYAMKANSNLAVLRLLSREGAGADILSGGELFRALKAGVSASRMVFSGVGKKTSEIEAALKAGILMFNVESPEELDAIHTSARRMKRQAPISIRVNPDVAVDTHHHITTGKAENKFGVAFDQAEALYRRAASMPWLKIVGIQAHIGSQILDVRPYGKTLKKLLSLIDRLKAFGISINILDMGGGLGVAYDSEQAPDPRALAGEIVPLLRGRNLRLILEPGRFLVAQAGCLVTQVLYRKEFKKNFVIVDAAMNDLLRPTLYDAYHPLWPVHRRSSRGSYRADVVGPICESGDVFAKDRPLPRPEQGDYLAIMGAGAYGFAMGSQYNARPRAPEVLVLENKWWVVRKRETFQDLIQGETIPSVLR
jgi:diaminopimelate decarboxylase